MTKNTVYIKTFGCSLNQSDSEVMGGLLKDSGYDVIINYGDKDRILKPSDLKSFDAVIINTCTVKNLAEAKFNRELTFWKNISKGIDIKSDIQKDIKIIIAGCVPQAEPGLLEEKLKDVSVIGTRQIIHIVDVLRETLNGRIVHNIDNDMNERLNLPKIRKNKIIEIIPISEGCMSKCSYCKTKFARGELLSYPKEKIIAQFKEAVNSGCKEFWITSQDNGCYGFDIYRKEKYFLPQLLDDLLSVDGDFRIRLGMSNPDHVDRIKEDLVAVFKHHKMFKFLHIPVQSGNDKVLKDMKRSYTVKNFENIIQFFRREIPDIALSTDIIVGFPGETDEEFADSMSLVTESSFDVLNISRFWLRKGTDAEKMKQLPGRISKSRCEQMKMLFDKLSTEKNRIWIGGEFKVLIDEYGKNNALIGRNDCYKQILIKHSGDKIANLGNFVNVKIVASKTYDIVGEVV